MNSPSAALVTLLDALANVAGGSWYPTGRRRYTVLGGGKVDVHVYRPRTGRIGIRFLGGRSERRYNWTDQDAMSLKFGGAAKTWHAILQAAPIASSSTWIQVGMHTRMRVTNWTCKSLYTTITAQGSRP